MRPLAYVWPYALAFWGVFLWVFWPEFAIVRRANRDKTATDAKSLQVILLGMNVAYVGSFPLASVRLFQVPPSLRLAAFAAGLLLCAAGSLLRRHCWKMLGASFTGDVRASADQAVVTGGAYGMLRHPSYTGGIMMNTGLGVALGSWGSAVLLMSVSFAVYVYRIAVEERALLAAIGEPYRAFMRTRKRLIPYVYGIAVATVGLGAAGRVDAQQQTGFLDRTVTVGGTPYRYQVYVPSGYAADRAWPVILFLHGSGERGRDGLLQTNQGLGPIIRADPSRYPAIVVFPQAPPDSLWNGMAAEAALAALDRTMAEYRVDRDRVYLTGLSMGGNGTWYLAYRNPDRFAAIVPICGWVTAAGALPAAAVPLDSTVAFTGLAQRLRGVPVWIFHGEIDPWVPVDQSRRAAEALRAAGGDVRYTELPGTEHIMWDAAYRSPAFVEWLFAQRRRR